MKVKKLIWLLLIMGIFLCSCEKKEQPYLNSLITAEQTLVIGRSYETNQKPTEKDIYYLLTGSDIPFSLDTYEFIDAEPNKEGLIYHILAKSPEQPNFNVYQIGDFLGITSSRKFVEEYIQQKEQDGDRCFIKNICIGICDIGKTDIAVSDTESIAQVEQYIQTILPEISLTNYTKEIIHGDAGQNIFSYYENDESKKNEVLQWTSLYDDTEIWITMCDRKQLDEFLVY